MRTELVKNELLPTSAVKKNRRADLTDQGQVVTDQRCDGLAGNEMRMDEVTRTLPLFSWCTAWAQGPTRPGPPYVLAKKIEVNGSAAVDKPLHIHRTRCAERRLLKTTHFFSTIGASPIQSLSSLFGTT